MPIETRGHKLRKCENVKQLQDYLKLDYCASHQLNWVNLQVLDATFDDIVPLAQTKMPDSICKCFLQADH